MLARAALLASLLASCTHEEPAPRAASGCPARFVDPRGRFSFCASASPPVSFTTSNDEHAGVFDYAYFAPKPGSTFTVVATSGPYDPPAAPAQPEIDESAVFAGRAARHARVRFHEHSPASEEMLEDRRHVRRAAEDHDVVVERWTTTTPSGGTIAVALRTQEDTTDATKSELQRALATLRFE